MRWRQFKGKEKTLESLEAELAPGLLQLSGAARMYAERRRSWLPLTAIAAERTQGNLSRPPIWRGWPAGAAFAAVCCGVAAVPLAYHSRPIPAPGPNITDTMHSSAPTDEAVLGSVNADLRSAVPAAMQPLALSTPPSPAAAPAGVRKD